MPSSATCLASARALGAIYILGGVSFIAKNFLVVVAPQYDLPYLIFPMFLAMAFLTLWLLIKGVDRARWDAMQTLPHRR
jgi:hypothetical protein